MQIVDTSHIDTFRSQVDSQNSQVRKLMSLLKTEGGRLKPAAISLITQAKIDGMKQAEIADILGVSRTAVNRNW